MTPEQKRLHRELKAVYESDLTIALLDKPATAANIRKAAIETARTLEERRTPK